MPGDINENEKGRLMDVLEQQVIGIRQRADVLKTIIRWIEEIFDYIYVCSHKTILKAVRSNPKGYVPFPIIFQSEHFINNLNLQGFPLVNQSQYGTLGILLNGQIQRCSKRLWSNPGNVRRIKAYDEGVTPIYIQNFPTENKCELFQTLIFQQCNITKIDYDKHRTRAIVYTTTPQALLAFDCHKWSIISQKGPNEGEVDEKYEYEMRVFTCEQFQRIGVNRASQLQAQKFQSFYHSKSQCYYPCFKEFMNLRRSSDKQYEKKDMDQIEEPDFEDYCINYMKQGTL